MGESTKGTSPSKIAKAAVATAADLGTGWTQYQKAAGVATFNKKACSVKAGSPVSSSDSGYSGPMYTNAAKNMFAYSSAVVFRNEADAKAHTGVLATPTFQNCKVAEDDAAQKHRDAKTFVKLYGTKTSDVGSPAGLEAYYSETEGSKNAAGEDALAAEYLRFVFRHGRVVYTLLLDVALASDTAAATALNDQIGTTIEAMNTAIDARLSAAGV
jgi:hypothetical protein